MKSKFLSLVIILAVGLIAAMAADKLTVAANPAQLAGGVVVTTTPTELLAFHGATPVAMRAGAAQVAVSTNAMPTVGTNYSQTDIQAIADRASALTVLANELRATLVEKGLMKGTTNAP